MIEGALPRSFNRSKGSTADEKNLTRTIKMQVHSAGCLVPVIVTQESKSQKKELRRTEATAVLVQKHRIRANERQTHKSKTHIVFLPPFSDVFCAVFLPLGGSRKKRRGRKKDD